MRWGLLSCAFVLVAAASQARANDTGACGQEGDPDRMIAACSHIISAGRGGRDTIAQAYTNRGFAYGTKGDYDREIAEETKAIELNPRQADAYANRGFAYSKKGDFDKEIADESTAIALEPQLMQPYNNRAFAYGQKGDFDHAIADENKAIELKNDLWGAYYVRGQAFAAKGNAAKALADFRVAAQQIPADDDRRGKAEARVAELEKQLAPAAPATSPGPAVVVATGPALPSAPIMFEPTATAPGKRVGLVIGNAAYGHIRNLEIEV